MEAPNAEIDENWIDPDDLETLFGVPFKPHERTTKKLVFARRISRQRTRRTEEG